MKDISTQFVTLTSLQPFTVAPIGNPSELGHLQQSYKECFSVAIQTIIGSSYNSTTLYRLYGCSVTGMHGNGTTGVTTITQGALFYGGEIFLCDGQSFDWGASLGPTGFDTAIVTTFEDVLGTQFSDGTVNNILQTRKIVFSGQIVPTPSVNGGLTPNFTTFVLPVDYQILWDSILTFIPIPGSGVWTNVNGYFPAGYKKLYNEIKICGSISGILPNVGVYNLFTLPIAPTNQVQFLISGLVGSTVYTILAGVNNSGVFFINTPSGFTSGSMQLFLDNISFRLS